MTADIAPQIPWDQITTIVVCILSSTWFSNRVVNHQSHKDIMDEIHKLNQKIDDNTEAAKNQLKETEAKTCRVHILRTNDELLQNQRHSKEYFDNTMDDITTYLNYCRSNPNFSNGKTKMAIENIENAYRTNMEKHSFL